MPGTPPNPGPAAAAAPPAKTDEKKPGTRPQGEQPGQAKQKQVRRAGKQTAGGHTVS